MSAANGNGYGTIEMVEDSPVPLAPLDRALSRIDRGREMAMEWAHGFIQTDNRYAKLCNDWHKLTPTERKGLSLDRFCREHEIEPADFLGEVVKVAMHYSQGESTLLTATMLPDVVKAGMENALKPEAEAERHKVLQNHGHRVVPKGAQTVFVNNVAAMAQANTEAETGLPSFEEDTMEMARTLRGGQVVEGQLLTEGEEE